MAAPITMALGVGLILLPIIALVLVLPTWAERTSDARDAARNAARALATANDWDSGVDAANRTVQEIATNNGLSPSDVQTNYSGALVPGATVTATITVTIPAVRFPGLAAFGATHFTANSTQQVDLYRPLP
jgi:hypothetical protein